MAPQRKRSGISLVEILVTLTITAVLLTAVAGAFHASLQSYTANDEMAAVTPDRPVHAGAG